MIVILVRSGNTGISYCVYGQVGSEAFCCPIYYKLRGILGVSDKSEIYDDATTSTHKN